MDVQHLNGDPLGRAVVTAVALGKLFLVNPADGSFELAFDIGIQNIGACYIAQTKNGQFLYVTLSNPNLLIILDASDPTNMKRIDKHPQPLVGPLYITLTPDEKQVVVSDYFLQEGPSGFVNLNANYMFGSGMCRRTTL
jgi:selenium-binding protein 1